MHPIPMSHFRRVVPAVQYTTELINAKGWFRDPGAYVLLDGQFGSTGKGLVASVLGSVFGHRFNVVTTNAGPNSGHTAFTLDKRKIVTMQIPVSAIIANGMGNKVWAEMNAGAIIDVPTFTSEVDVYNFPKDLLRVHPNAAVVKAHHKGDDAHHIASTGKGVGPALAEKIMRQGSLASDEQPLSPYIDRLAWDWEQDIVLVETAQGFGLSLNGQFWPHCTSREVTVGQALADARIPPSRHRKTLMVLRTYPIRVGNTDRGTSGGCYPDQMETSWEELGQTAEMTTVTKRIRRVFSWSWTQFREAIRVNEPDALMINFCNYGVGVLVNGQLAKGGPEHISEFLEAVNDNYLQVLGRLPDFIWTGWGPEQPDVFAWRP